LWNESRPADIDESIDQYLNHAFEWSANRDQWLGLLKPFLQDYTAKMGKPPVLNPQVRFKVYDFQVQPESHPYCHVIVNKYSGVTLRVLQQNKKNWPISASNRIGNGFMRK
jgi:hypothetical protein